jgi:hypothetical protein
MLVFVLAVPALGQKVDQSRLKLDSVSVVGIEGDAMWLRDHLAHVVIDKKRVGFPVVVSKDGMVVCKDGVVGGSLTMGAKVTDDGVVLLIIDGNEHPVVVSPKTAMKVTKVFSVTVPPNKNSKGALRLVLYIGVAAKSFDWDESKSPTKKELLKIVDSKVDSPKE